jgi:AraC-like DNA-binding protein
MKARLLNIQNDQKTSFDLRYEEAAFFDNPWHYHPELELTLVLESEGIRFVGDSVEPFAAYDLVLLGSNLPHFWRNNAAYYQGDSNKKARAIILRFKKDLWGTSFWHAPEMQSIADLWKRAERGLHFPALVGQHLEPLLLELLEAEGSKRMWLWVQIFELLSQSEGHRQLSQVAFANQNPDRDSERIQTVLNFLQNHLSDPLTLEQVAATVNMNASAFSRYFKQQTNKNFIETLNELRINYACRLLLDSSLDIGQLAFEAGFRNVPHFNLVFKKVMQKTPGEYRMVRVKR